MNFWSRSECETFYADGRISTTEPCEVRIGPGVIIVDAGLSSGGWMWKGEETGPGHFRFNHSVSQGEGTLHCFEGMEYLEGWWMKDGAYGMWRITLACSELDE